MDRLKLMALDEEDLTVLSAHVQDAVTKPEALDYRAPDKRFNVVVNRFAWDAAERRNGRRETFERRQAVLSFARVLNVRTLGVRRGDADQVLSLLALRFAEEDAPAGTLELVFADGAAVQLEVECIEAQLEDLGAAWETRFKPRHPTA